jgi:hypothetical protein
MSTATIKNPSIYNENRPRKTRRKTGCITCRTRKKRCSEQRPVCGSCQRLNLPCQYPETPSTLKPQEAPVSAVSSVSRNSAWAIVLQCDGPDAVALFDFFCDQSAPWLINGESMSNPVLRHIIPLMDKRLIRHTVLAIAAAHRQTTIPSATLMTKFYTSALAELSSALSGWLSHPTDFKPILTSIVLLCHCEVSLATFCILSLHLAVHRRRSS